MEIFKLFGSIAVDNEAANKSISETDKKAGGLAEKFSKGVGTAAKWGTAIAGSAVAVGAAVLGAADKAAQAADEIDKGSIRMGISTDAYQELRYAAGQCGVEMSTMEKAAKKLEGTDIDLDDAMKSIMALTTEEERSAKAAELFGDAVAYQMAPLLQVGGEGFDDLTSRAHELGLVMDEDAVSAGVTFGDTLSDVKQSLGAIGTQIAAELLPVAQSMLNWVLAHLPEIQAVVGGVIGFIKEGITALTPLIEAIMPIVDKVFKGIVSLWDTVLKPMLDGVITFLTGVFTGNWSQAFEGLSKIVESVFNGMVELVKKPINSIIGLINEFFGSLGSIDIPDWVPVIGGKSFSLPQIPQLAKGGTVVDDGTVMVGERGAELLTLGKGAKVTPLNGGESSLTDKLDEVMGILSQYLPNIGSNIVLNNGALVGSMAPQMDIALGRIQTQKARGV